MKKKFEYNPNQSNVGKYMMVTGDEEILQEYDCWLEPGKRYLISDWFKVEDTEFYTADLQDIKVEHCEILNHGVR